MRSIASEEQDVETASVCRCAVSEIKKQTGRQRGKEAKGRARIQESDRLRWAGLRWRAAGRALEAWAEALGEPLGLRLPGH